MSEIFVEDVMSKDIVCVELQATMAAIAATMRERVSSCVIVAEGGRALGIITERDLVGILAKVLEDPGISGRLAAELMTSPPITIRENSTLLEALVLCRTRRIRHLLVVDRRGLLAGVVTQSDVVRAHQNLLETQGAIIEDAVERRTGGLRRANERLSTLSLEDPLLGTGNRRAMEIELAHTHAAAVHYNSIYSVALFDVDHFKLFNDRYGHGAGDRTLKRVAASLQGATRASDRLYRYGGEELLLLLPRTSARGAEALARRLVDAVAALAIPHMESPFGIVTVSAGTSAARLGVAPDAGWETVVNRADQALYRAKTAGRNRVVMAGRSRGPVRGLVQQRRWAA